MAVRRLQVSGLGVWRGACLGLGLFVCMRSRTHEAEVGEEGDCLDDNGLGSGSGDPPVFWLTLGTAEENDSSSLISPPLIRNVCVV